MTDTDTTPVRTGRHAVQDAVRNAQSALNVEVRSDASYAIVSPLREVDGMLKGRQGFTKEQQVETLQSAAEKVAEVKKGLKKNLKTIEAEYKAAVAEATKAVTEQVAAAEKALADVQKTAAERDFEEHQQAKGKVPAHSGW